jgi:hypothetical protein
MIKNNKGKPDIVNLNCVVMGADSKDFLGDRTQFSVNNRADIGTVENSV